MKEETGLRADALRNRERILAAAEEVFLARGAGASLEEVARQAGVGIGTLYRRFPTREALLAAVYNERLLAFARSSQATADQSDPAGALRAYLEGLVMNMQIYQGLATSLGAVLLSGTPGCYAVAEEGKRLLRGGQNTGIIRREVTFEDLVFVLTAVSLLTEQESAAKSRIAHLIDLFLSGICTR